MFERTYTPEAVRLARTISSAAKKDIEGLKFAELRELGQLFFDSIMHDVTEQRAIVHAALVDANKAGLAHTLRAEATVVVKRDDSEAAARWEFNERNGFFARLHTMRDKHAAEAKKFAAALATEAWNWKSYVDDFMQARAHLDVLDEVISRIESYCWDLSLSQATEHALHELQVQVVQQASYGTSRSTSQVYNAAEDKLQQARSRVLDSTRGMIGPVDHGKKLGKSWA